MEVVETKGRLMDASLTIAVCFGLLAVAHSALGEVGIVRPLLAAEWTVDMPRWAIERIVRFAWHLTSITWVAVALIVLDVELMPVIGVMSLASAVVIFVMLRGHLAWPIFLVAGLAAFYEFGSLTDGVLKAGAVLTVAVLIAAAGLHVYWACGGTWMLDRAVPSTSESNFTPGPALTLAVAGALTVFAGLVAGVAFGFGPSMLAWPTMAGVGVLTIRAVGDGKVAGFTKEDHESDFGRADDRYFTPIVVMLALGASGALLV